MVTIYLSLIPKKNLCIGGLPPNLNSPSTCREALAASPLIVGQAALAAQVFSDQSFPVLKIIHPVAGDTAAARRHNLGGIHVFTILLEAEIQMRAGGISGCAHIADDLPPA